tara:strand:- start:854 stop:2353 length:1500 start_codon:yes stop_codon:yes gene_type:complete
MIQVRNIFLIFVFFLIVISIPFLEFFSFNLNFTNEKNNLKINFLTVKRLFFLYLIFLLIFSSLIIFIKRISKMSLFDISIILSFIYWVIFKYNEIKKLLNLINFNILKSYDGFFSITFTLLAILLFVFFYKKKKTNFINIFILFFFIINFTFLSSNILMGSNINKKNQIQNFEFENLNIKNLERNNIYLFIIDSMPPIKFADKILKTESKFFLDELRSNNFNYIDNSRSIYGNTALTLGSIFNLKPLKTKNNEFVKTYDQLEYPHLIFPTVLRKKYKSNLEYNLTKLGYNIKWIGSHFSNCYGYNRQYCIDEIDNENILINYEILSFLKKTAFQPIVHNIFNFFNFSIEERIIFKSNNAISYFERYLEKTGKPAKPTFVLIHHLVSHWPYLVDENCKYEKNPGRINKIGIKKAFECNKKLISNISKKISEIDNQAIVVIQSDHNWELSNLDLSEYGDRNDIFNVIKTNDFCEKFEHNASNNIDTIRMALYCATNTKPLF